MSKLLEAVEMWGGLQYRVSNLEIRFYRFPK